VNIHEAKTQLSRLIELTQTGQEFIIAKAGKPVARLMPIDREKPPRRLGLILDYQVFYFDKVATCGSCHACGCPIFQ
jgi:prevent-host-death family protein